MTFNEIEESFNRALLSSLNKKKFFLVFPVLFLCGLLIVFSRALAYSSSNWIAMSVVFIAIFLSSGFLLSVGVLLIKFYHNEVKSFKSDFLQILKESSNLLIGTIYLSLPPILIYLLIWFILGFFILLKEIPHIGPFFSVILSFAPFILIFSAILLVFMNLAILFFLSPEIAFHNKKENYKIVKKIKDTLSQKIFSSMILFLIGLLPVGIIVGFLSIAANLTAINFLGHANCLSVSLDWFFIMIPFCIVLTPCIIFFFNFSYEVYNLLFKRV